MGFTSSVLLDLKLPRISGIDVLRRIRAHPYTFQRAVERIALYWLVVNQPPPVVEREVA